MSKECCTKANNRLISRLDLKSGAILEEKCVVCLSCHTKITPLTGEANIRGK